MIFVDFFHLKVPFYIFLAKNHHLIWSLYSIGKQKVTLRMPVAQIGLNVIPRSGRVTFSEIETKIVVIGEIIHFNVLMQKKKKICSKECEVLIVPSC